MEIAITYVHDKKMFLPIIASYRVECHHTVSLVYMDDNSKDPKQSTILVGTHSHFSWLFWIAER